MDILKISTEWAKDELVSTSFFFLIGIVFVLVSIGFWQFGKTDLAKSYIIPILVAGAFLMAVGIGLFFTNKTRIIQFESSYKTNAPAFIAAEMDRVEATLKEYKTIVFTGIPVLIAVCALIIFFVNTPIWRASAISFIAMASVILIIDGLAHARIAEYNQHLLEAQQAIKK